MNQGSGVNAGVEIVAPNYPMIDYNVYHPFVEWYPGPKVEIPNFPIGVGDIISCLIGLVGPTTSAIYVINITRAQVTQFNVWSPDSPNLQ